MADAAKQAGVVFRGVKKAIQQNADSEFDHPLFDNVYANGDIDAANYDRVSGTAWLFADLQFDQAFDYLFVAEAGQVSLGAGTRVVPLLRAFTVFNVVQVENLPECAWCFAGWQWCKSAPNVALGRFPRH